MAASASKADRSSKVPLPCGCASKCPKRPGPPMTGNLRHPSTSWLAIVPLFLAAAAVTAEDESRQTDEPTTVQLPAASQRQVDFAKDIQPIFQAKCYSCHSAEEQEGGFRLDIAERGRSMGAIRARRLCQERAAKARTGFSYCRYWRRRSHATRGRRNTADRQAKWRFVRAVDRSGSRLARRLPMPIRSPAITGRSSRLRILRCLKVKDDSRVHNGIDAFIIRKLEEEGINVCHPKPTARR